MSTISSIYNSLFAGEKIKVVLRDKKELQLFRVNLQQYKARQEKNMRKVLDEEVAETTLSFKKLGNQGTYEISITEKKKPQEFLILTDLDPEILEIFSEPKRQKADDFSE